MNMQNLRNKLIACVAVLTLAAIGTMMNRQAARAADPPGAPVNIMSPIPLPVTGTVAVTGSTTVSGSVAATQSGTWNVGINGTPNVNVANPATAPALTMDISKSALRYVELICTNNPSGNCTQVSGGTYIVPSGQNLVVTSVEITGTPVGGGGMSLYVFSHSSGGDQWVVPNDGNTHSFQFPGSGIVYPAGFTFNSSNVIFFGNFGNIIPSAILVGFLTPI
jgi:hypothetical protein